MDSPSFFDKLKSVTGLTSLQLAVSIFLCIQAICVFLMVSAYIYLKYTGRYWHCRNRSLYITD
jgi:hypothetical protein